MRKILFSLSGLIMLFTGCKKFPEGGLYSNRRAVFSQNMKKAEFWDIKLYEVDGIDSTDLIVSNNDASLRKRYVRFFKYGHDNYYSGTGFTPFGITVGPDYISFSNGRKAWDELVNGVKIREILTPNGKGMTWTIRKCKKKELILSGSKNNVNYRVILENP